MATRSHPRPDAGKLVTAAAVAATVLALVGCGSSGEPDIEVGRAQASEPVAGSAQVVLDVTNLGDGPDTIAGADTTSAFAVEMHQTIVDDGSHSMTEIETVDVDAGETVRFRPGQVHLMLVAPDEELAVGGTFELILHLERSGDVTVPVEVVDLLDLAEGTFDETDDSDP